MSGIPGHVTRKDGKISELPERVTKMLKWLTIAAYAVPILMLLIGLGSYQAALAPWLGTLLSLIPVGLIMGVLVGILRTGKWGNAFFGGGLVMMHYMAFSVEPYTNTFGEMLFTRLTPIIGVAALLFFLKQDLMYNLRPLWYSLSAMKDFQEMMMKAQMKKDAKKRGEDFDENKVIDVEAQLKAFEKMTGQAVPNHMRGMAAKPGFRQEGGKKQGGGSGGKKRKRR